MGKSNLNCTNCTHYFPMTTTGLLWSRKGTKIHENNDEIFAPVGKYFRCALTEAIQVGGTMHTGKKLTDLKSKIG